MSKACFTVTGNTVKTEGGGTSTIVRGPTKMKDGGLMYSSVDAPLGIYYPKDTAIELPAGYELKDVPKQDRIWNGQTVDMYVRAEAGAASSAAAAPSVKGFPAELQGEWCSMDGKNCFSLAEFRAENPESFLSSKSASTEVRGATEYTVCYVRNMGSDGCTTSASMFLRYLPDGTAWNCKTMGAPRFNFSKCKPDYTKDHDVSKARLVIQPNHQHDADFVDSQPLYRK
ncbi:hypothetical protein DWB68_02430 [Galactobacter valiniphilus]|uniref:Uncharacterized protein n=1 Tax=Galactobacter valiniphilus TaxID=2676122 RepID=A0A399JD61_9MICC|nr:hypothetical protein [Galactobacter valiniphilus]RII43478.1 hypothetical protein DWB68_02430 [Galactobacter valiniphilus]